jgi:hypothetical protein
MRVCSIPAPATSEFRQASDAEGEEHFEDLGLRLEEGPDVVRLLLILNVKSVLFENSALAQPCRGDVYQPRV